MVELKAEGKSPIMEDVEFHRTFKNLFEDEDELDEAVYFLNLQGEEFLTQSIIAVSAFTGALLLPKQPHSPSALT